MYAVENPEAHIRPFRMRDVPPLFEQSRSFVHTSRRIYHILRECLHGKIPGHTVQLSTFLVHLKAAFSSKNNLLASTASSLGAMSDAVLKIGLS